MSTVWFCFPSSSSSSLFNTHIFQSRNLFKSVAEDLNTIISELFLQSPSHFQQSNPRLKQSFAHWNTFQSNWATWNGRNTEVYVLQSSQFMRQFILQLAQPFMSLSQRQRKLHFENSSIESITRQILLVRKNIVVLTRGRSYYWTTLNSLLSSLLLLWF